MKKELKTKAVILRKSGKSFREIGEELGISKSTASLWTRDEKMSHQGKARFYNLIEASKLKAKEVLFDKNKIYLEKLDKECTVLKNKNKYSKDDLKVFLALLYWGEGSKTEKTFTFTNSDPRMVAVYLKLFKASFDVSEEKIKAFLHLHDYHDKIKMINFWSKVTGIDKKRISIYNKKNSGNRRKEDYKGCISVRYHNYKFFDEIMLIIDRFTKLKI